MSSERRGGDSCRLLGNSKLFQMIGRATAKLLILSVLLVVGTDSDPVPAALSSKGCD